MVRIMDAHTVRVVRKGARARCQYGEKLRGLAS